MLGGRTHINIVQAFFGIAGTEQQSFDELTIGSPDKSVSDWNLRCPTHDSGGSCCSITTTRMEMEGKARVTLK